MEKPSKSSAKASASRTLEGISAITWTSRPPSPRLSPPSAITSKTFSPSSGVRQKGTMTMRFLRPISSLTRLTAATSRRKPSL